MIFDQNQQSVNLDPEKFFQVVRDDGRRGHNFELFKRRYRLDVGQFKFANRVCEEWNGLDDDVVEVGSVNAFKRKLDHHLRNVRGIFKHLLFSLLIMAIHGYLLLEAWMDPGNPGRPGTVCLLRK